MSSTTLNIGIIDFINAMPFFYKIAERSPSSFKYTYGTPQEINALLENGSLDVALISSASFLDNRSDYLLLSSLGIACHEEVLSVKLYYKGNLQSLSKIIVPWCSKTSTALLKILCKHLWKINPEFLELKKSAFDLVGKADAFLTIGDECLQLGNPQGYQSIDLAEAWHEWTDKPFVFALFATRVESLKQKHPLLKDFFRLLEAQLHSFELNPDEVISECVKRLKCPVELVRSYFHVLDHRVNEEHFSGLERYALLR